MHFADGVRQWGNGKPSFGRFWVWGARESLIWKCPADRQRHRDLGLSGEHRDRHVNVSEAMGMDEAIQGVRRAGREERWVSNSRELVRYRRGREAGKGDKGSTENQSGSCYHENQGKRFLSKLLNNIKVGEGSGKIKMKMKSLITLVSVVSVTRWG